MEEKAVGKEQESGRKSQIVIKKEPKVGEDKGKMVVSVDNVVKDVLKWDIEGREIYFEDDVDKFLEIPDEVVKELSLITRQRYKLAKSAYKDAVKEKERGGSGLEYLSKIKVTGKFASATQKLKVYDQKKGWHQCYKRPDEIQTALSEGYRPAKDVKTFNSDVGSVHYVGTHGEPELILFEIPEEEFQKRLKKAGDLSRQRVEAVSTEGLMALGSAGQEVGENKASTEKISKH